MEYIWRKISGARLFGKFCGAIIHRAMGYEPLVKKDKRELIAAGRMFPPVGPSGVEVWCVDGSSDIHRSQRPTCMGRRSPFSVPTPLRGGWWCATSVWGWGWVWRHRACRRGRAVPPSRPGARSGVRAPHGRGGFQARATVPRPPPRRSPAAVPRSAAERVSPAGSGPAPAPTSARVAAPPVPAPRHAWHAPGPPVG